MTPTVLLQSNVFDQIHCYRLRSTGETKDEHINQASEKKSKNWN
jgi:hypothetical protein